MRTSDASALGLCRHQKRETLLAMNAVFQGLVLLLALISPSASFETKDFCSSITTCLENGSLTCDTTTGNCPPCLYALDNTYTCWKKDNITNTCPYTGVRYDCADSWSSTTSSSSTNSATSLSPADAMDSTLTASSSSLEISADALNTVTMGGLSSSLLTYGAISLGAFLVLVILVILCARRRKIRRRYEENIAATEAGSNRVLSDRRLRGLAKPRDDASVGSYNNILDTSKVNYTVPSVMSEYGRSHLSRVPTDESPSMLGDTSDFPAVLGKTSGPYKSGGRSAHATPVAEGIGRYSNVSEYVQQDVSLRCTSTPDVFGEYLRMKQEMQYDEGDGSIMGRSGRSFSDLINDLDSSKGSLESFHDTSRLPQRRTDLDERSSMAESITDSIANSVTDSEYAEQLRARSESDCFSEMSYNDEKYSFSSVEGLDDSQVRVGKREVEI